MDTSDRAVVKRGSQRRRRSVEQKRRIVEDTLQPGASVARVARAHEVNANQVFAWRRLYRQGLLEQKPARVLDFSQFAWSNGPEKGRELEARERSGRRVV